VLPKHIKHWDDERSLDHGIIVTLVPGLSFEWCSHEGVRGFETVTEARYESARKRLFVCDPCEECDSNRTSEGA
jgi:hypothetical protein